MPTRILGLEGSKGVPPLPRDFGIDLMAMDDATALEWIDKCAARCNGDWAQGEYEAVIRDAENLIPQWREIFDKG